MPLAKAEKQPLTTERLREQLGRLGGTPFKLGELKNHLAGEVMLPVSELNRLRREVVAELERQRAQPKRWTLESWSRRPPSLGTATDRQTPDARRRTPQSDLIVLVRNLAQLEAALKCGVATVYCEFENPKKYREAVTLFHTARGCAAIVQPPASSIAAQPSWSPRRASSRRARNGCSNRCAPATPTAISSATTTT